VSEVEGLPPQFIRLPSASHSPDRFGTAKRPSIRCIRWQSRSWVRHVVRWVDHVAHGNDDRRQDFTKTKLVEGGSIGPVPARNQKTSLTSPGNPSSAPKSRFPSG
jgi:hypothetical protein